jgi:hypothetical protein
MRTIPGLILILVALATLGHAAEPMTAPADVPSPYQLQLSLPAEPVPVGWAYPVTTEVRNDGDTPLVLAHRVDSSTLGELGTRKLPEGACLVVVVDRAAAGRNPAPPPDTRQTRLRPAWEECTTAP